MSLTAFLATYGALLSSVALGWNLYRDLRDRASVKVRLSLKRIATSTDGRQYAVAPDLNVADTTEQVFVYLSITNVGRRPVKLVGMGGTYKRPVNGKSSFQVAAVNVPKLLSEGEDTFEFNPDFVLVSENVKSLYMYDTTHKEWKVGRRNLRLVKEQAKQYENQSVMEREE